MSARRTYARMRARIITKESDNRLPRPRQEWGEERVGYLNDEEIKPLHNDFRNGAHKYPTPLVRYFFRRDVFNGECDGRFVLFFAVFCVCLHVGRKYEKEKKLREAPGG